MFWMKKTDLTCRFIVFMIIMLFIASCITEKELYQSASGEKELPKWRVLARAREAYGPYIQWKEDLIRELYAGRPPAIHFSARYPSRTWALILECAVIRQWIVSSDNIEENIYFGYLMYQDPFLWTSDVVGTHAPRMIGKSTIEMESSLGKQETEKLMDHIMSDPQRVKVLAGLMKSMSPGELRKSGMENDIEQLEKVSNLPLKEIQAPTLVIHGTNDADVSVEDAKFAKQNISDAELFIVPGGFHVMALTDSIDEITQKRVSFLRKHASEK